MSSSHQFRNCPVCAHTEARPYLLKGRLALVRCLSCSMVYANPVPDDFASGSYYDQEASEYYLSPDKLAGDYAATRFERELCIFRKYCAQGTVLDVGCSTGGFLHQLNLRFPGDYEIYGMDASGSALNYAESRGVIAVHGAFLRDCAEQQRFDALTFWAVLEHVLEPAAFLKKAAALLKPSGLCVVLVPNLNSLAVKLLGRRYRYIYPQHLNYFARETLAALVREHFDLIELKTTHFNPIVIWQDVVSGGADVPNTERARLLKRTTSYKQNSLLKPVKAAYSCTEWMLSRLSLADNLAAVLRKKPSR